jgi:NADP-dependent 3-hydroxy acid dehydrogenase YdfG
MVPAFVKAGVKGIVLLASNAEKLVATEKSVKAASPSIGTLTYALDISDPKAVEAAFEKVKEKFGHADVLINAAGAMTGDGPKLHETDPDEWWRNFVSNLVPSLSKTFSSDFHQVVRMNFDVWPRKSTGKATTSSSAPFSASSLPQIRPRPSSTSVLGRLSTWFLR